MASLQSASVFSSSELSRNSTIFSSGAKIGENELISSRFLDLPFKINPSLSLRLRASTGPQGLAEETVNTKIESKEGITNRSALFEQMKQRFLSFKRDKYLQNLEHFKDLAESQAPKFMVIACADSRVCPSSILGFQPGEAFTVRNIANLVPPFEGGPSETNAALEFAVNSLEVENILVVGHSRCGGIRALMSMHDEEVDSRSFIRSWVTVGNNAKLSTKAAASNLDFDQQCQHCEKESVNRSLQNLLTYPWIKERVAKGLLCIHGGYYDFVDCTFETWTLDFTGDPFSIKNPEFWS